MTVEQLREICLRLPGVEEDIKWGHDICFSIGSKMFLVTSADKNPVGASFKVADEDFELMIEREGFSPAPYLARHKWIMIDDIRRVSKKEMQQLAGQSYQLVKARLPKQARSGGKGK